MYDNDENNNDWYLRDEHCPECGGINNCHDEACTYEGVPWEEITGEVYENDSGNVYDPTIDGYSYEGPSNRYKNNTYNQSKTLTSQNSNTNSGNGTSGSIVWFILGLIVMVFLLYACGATPEAAAVIIVLYVIIYAIVKTYLFFKSL